MPGAASSSQASGAWSGVAWRHRRVLSSGTVSTICADVLDGRVLVDAVAEEQNVGVAAVLADQAHVLKHGVVACSGPASELIGSPEVGR